MPTIEDAQNLRVPFSGAYWVVSGRLLAGCHPCFYAPRACPELLGCIVDTGIRRFIDLTEAHERIPGMNDLADYSAYLDQILKTSGVLLQHHREAIVDRGIPSYADMVRILDKIDGLIQNGIPVYLHCMGGIGRTGTVVGCYLARHGYATGEAVINYIAGLRTSVDFIDWPSPESRQQIEMVVSWEKGK